jgi:bifunctional non-homologous end joining protein LigD
VFDLLHHQRRDQVVMLCAFDVLSINGEDVRREPIEERKAELAKLLRRPRLTASLSMSSSPATVRSSIATLAGSAARVSSAKRLGSPYRGGRFAHWVKVKNPNAPAVKREAEQDWN